MEANKYGKNHSSVNGEYLSFPDPVELINKIYKDASLMELKEKLVDFSSRISNTKKILDKMIPKNFVNYIRFKGEINNIRNDYKDKKLIDTNSENFISKTISDLENLNAKYKLDTDHESFFKSQKLVSISRLKEILRSNILSFEIFIMNLKKEINLLDDSELASTLEKIKPEIVDFLDLVYEKIMSSSVCFEESLVLLDYFHYASTLQGGYSDSLKRSKICNTVLVQYKENTFSKINKSDEYHTYLFKSLLKVLKYLQEEQALEAINHLFKCFKIIIADSDYRYSLVIIRRVEDFGKTFKSYPYCLKEFKSGISRLKIESFELFVLHATVSECVNIFNTYVSVLRENEMHQAQNILYEKVLKGLLKTNLTGLDYINAQKNDLDLISPCLGFKGSKLAADLDKNLRYKRNQEINEISQEFLSLFKLEKTLDNDTRILMAATKIAEDSPTHKFKILLESKDEITKRPIVFYFLCYSLKVEAPSIDSKLVPVIDELRFQFGHLLDPNSP